MGEETFEDLELSREMMRDHHSRLDSQSVGLMLTVMVLQRSAWPFTVQKSGVDIPLCGSPCFLYAHWLTAPCYADASRVDSISQLLQASSFGAYPRLGSCPGNGDDEG